MRLWMGDIDLAKRECRWLWVVRPLKLLLNRSMSKKARFASTLRRSAASENATVTQLDSASDYESRGRTFESFRGAPLLPIRQNFISLPTFAAFCGSTLAIILFSPALDFMSRPHSIDQAAVYSLI